MRTRYFSDTDMLWIELGEVEIGETRDLDEDTLTDLDAEGRVCAITLEHASPRTDPSSVRYEQFPA
jgi:uncharacterized protein YuzE